MGGVKNQIAQVEDRKEDPRKNRPCHLNGGRENDKGGNAGMVGGSRRRGKAAGEREKMFYTGRG